MGKLFLTAIVDCRRGRKTEAQDKTERDETPLYLETTVEGQVTPTPAPATAPTQPADGSRHGLPLETFAGRFGDAVLVPSKISEHGRPARAISNSSADYGAAGSGSGFYLPSGAEIRAHVKPR